MHKNLKFPTHKSCVLNLMRCGTTSARKSTNFGYGRHLIETPDTSWIGSVAVRTNKHYQNSSIASPHSTLRRNYTDKWQVYESVLPASKHVQTKAETHRIERNNCLMRHWFGRFKRKSIIVSKSVEMVELTITLFARFRVNGNVLDILNLGGESQPNTII